MASEKETMEMLIVGETQEGAMLASKMQGVLNSVSGSEFMSMAAQVLNSTDDAEAREACSVLMRGLTSYTAIIMGLPIGGDEVGGDVVAEAMDALELAYIISEQKVHRGDESSRVLQLPKRKR